MNDPYDHFDDDPFAAHEARLSAMAAPRGPMAAPWLDGLNPAQRAAVEALDGPVLVLAGAGTGKTRVLTARMAHLLSLRKAFPSQILAVTFTNKAAREMKNRVGAMIGGDVEGMPWLGTFHSVSAKILRRHAELAGLQSNFTILDADDQLRLLKQLIRAENIDEKRWPPRMLAAFIDRWKNRGLTPEKLPEREGAQFAQGLGGKLYADYQARLRTLNAVDFGDLLLSTLRIFQEHPEILAQYQDRFRYVLVDEYQDTNVAQYLWLRLLAAGRKNICCVGDDDQSIYGWRGAEVGNILKFEKDFPGAQIIRLEQNYRSTPHILAAASAVIAGNEERLGKTLWTDALEGERLRLMGLWDGEEEARWIGEEIEALGRGTRGLDPIPPEQTAVLVRASHQMRAFEDRFLAIGMPYRVIGGPRFYERLEIRDAIAYLRMVAQPDDGLAFERIVNTPKRGLGEKALQAINVVARERDISLPRAAQAVVDEGGLPPKQRAALAQLLDSFERWRRIHRDPNSDLADHELAEVILDESGYTDMWRADKSAEAPGRLENLKELSRSIAEFETLGGFLEHISLVMEAAGADAQPSVSIMTLHAAKGLEFDAVFLPGWEDGLFPSQRAMDETGRKGLEEERRLAYVGITRARQLLTITFAANRRVYNQWQSSIPSRFIDELPRQNVEVLTPSGLSGGGARASYGGGFQESGAAFRGGGLEERAANASVYNSPGWRRLQSQGGGRPSGASARAAARASATIADFEIGERVFHQKFGYGVVTDMEADKVAVNFDTSGVKHLMASFIVPAAQAAGDDDVPF